MVGMAKAKSMKTVKGYSVRPATLDDLKPIVGIYNWAVNQTFATIDSEPLSAEEAQAWWEMHGKRSVLLVSTDETGVIGWARLLPWKQRGFDVVECLVYVDPAHHAPATRRAPRVLPLVARPGPGELHPTAIDAVADGHIDAKSGLTDGLGINGATYFRQHVVEQRPAADEARDPRDVHLPTRV